MSYSTWHNYGYGICVDDIKTQDVKRMQALLELAPETKAKIGLALRIGNQRALLGRLHGV